MSCTLELVFFFFFLSFKIRPLRDHAGSCYSLPGSVLVSSGLTLRVAYLLRGRFT